MAVFWADPLAQPGDLLFTYFYPRILLEETWTASIVVVNVGQATTDVRLSAYDNGGALIQELLSKPTLAPGDRAVYSAKEMAWPPGTSSLKIESESALVSFLVMESNDGKGLEATLPATAPEPSVRRSGSTPAPALSSSSDLSGSPGGP